jgi:hypothetical protein
MCVQTELNLYNSELEQPNEYGTLAVTMEIIWLLGLSLAFVL